MSENHLVVTSGPAAGRRLDMDDELWIGRATDGPGRLEGDDALEAQHARIARDKQGRLVVEDLGSPGGTAVNGVTIATPHVLQVGDRIEVGNTVLELAGADAASPTEGPVHAPSLRRGSLPASIKGVVFPSVGLLLIQLLTGYLWLASGLTKIFKDGEVYVGGKKQFADFNFVDGFKPFMRDSLVLFEQPVFFTNFIKDVVIKNDRLFAYATIVVEVAVGILLIVAALLWLFAWQRLSHAVRVAVLLATIVASLVATGLNLQLWLLYGADIPIAIGEDPFGEAFGLDLYLPVVQIVLGGVALWTLLSLRRARRGATAR
jgi:uncharacterized membrane protein YphA (DoxX/SURF4 family)